MNFVFIIDDSPSMGLSGNGLSNLTSLEICKAAIEQFLITIKQSLPHDKQQFMLLHTGPDRSCILSMYNEPLADFEDALKQLKVSDKERDVSYAISLAFTTINKYRIRNGTDRFGAGRLPSVTEPTTIIFLSTGVSLNGKEILLSKGSMSAGSDLYYEPFRWDQKFVAFILSTSGNLKVDTREVQALAEATGGEVVVSDSFQSMLGNVKSFVQKAASSSVVVKVAVDSNVHDEYKDVVVLSKLTGKHTMEWPIPEAFWVDKNVDNIPIRSAHPILKIDKERNSWCEEIALLQEFDSFHDSYDMVLAFSGHESGKNECHSNKYNVYKVFGLDIEKQYLAYIRGSQRLDGHSADPLSLRQPCGLLSPGKSSIGGSAELLILPIDFPKLLKILKNALACKQFLTASIRSDMGYYLWSTPGYYYMTLASLLQRLGLSHLIQIPESCIFGKGVGKRLQRLQQIASSDILNLELKKKERWTSLSIDPFTLTSIFSQGLCSSLPSDVATEDIVGVWDRLGRSFYGYEKRYSQGVSLRPPASSYLISSKDSDYRTITRKFVQPVSSLASFLARESNSVNLSKCMEIDSPKNTHTISILTRFCTATSRLRDNFCSICGGCMISQKAITQMGNYAITLTRKEIGRDATNEHFHHEDTPYGLLKRKLDINFGSPYKKIDRKVFDNSRQAESFDNPGSYVSSFEEMEHAISKIFADTPVPERDFFIGGVEDFLNDGELKNEFCKEEHFTENEQSIESSIRVSALSSPINSPMMTDTEIVCNFPPFRSVETLSSKVVLKDDSKNTRETLPSGWIKQYSKSKKREYWFNTLTGFSSWIHPSFLSNPHTLR